MALKFSISPHNQHLSNKQIHSAKNLPNISSMPNSQLLIEKRNSPPGSIDRLVTPSRRKLLSISILNALLINGTLQGIFGIGNDVLAQEYSSSELERYTDTKEGFTLLVPTSYVKVDKAGATVLFEEANKGSNNVGVVVNPVRLNSLGEFGSPRFVADKLVQAEKRKESTMEAEVIAAGERLGNGGLQVYEIEYKLDSTRGGLKRVFTAAFVASRKLYLLNIVHSDKEESPLDKHTRELLEQVLHSFDAADPVA